MAKSLAEQTGVPLVDAIGSVASAAPALYALA
jgi:hypothetical protein